MQDLIDLQNQIVQTVVQGVEGEWARIMVNFEYEDVDNEVTVDCLAVSFVLKSRGLLRRRALMRQSFIIPQGCYELFEALHQAAKDPWGSCTLEIDPDGKYRFSFSFELPKRLNGDITSDEAMLKHYDARLPL